MPSPAIATTERLPKARFDIDPDAYGLPLEGIALYDCSLSVGRKNSGSHLTPRWRKQSRANPSLVENSLLAGEFAGNFARFGYSGAFQMPENVCESKPLPSQFPTHPSREFLRRRREFNRAIREGCGGIRDLALSVEIILVI